MENKNLSYKDAGVDKHAGYQEVNLIKKFIKNTYIPGVLSDLGGFSGLFELDKTAYKQPVLVSGTDGVGTKVKLAQMLDKHNTVGIDCVAMCVNDILCQGAKPLFFLDYIATGKLIPEKMASIVEGVADGCVQAGAALIGGETAEMPGIYKEEDYDIAGFCVGVVDKDKIIDGKKTVCEGDVLIALPSSGVHSNGFSLVRKIIFDKMNFDLSRKCDELELTLGETLLTPTRIYAKEVMSLLNKFDIHALSHITGGGLYENLPRVLPDHLSMEINCKAIQKPVIFDLLQKWGSIATDEMYGTFNMGVGMVVVVAEKDADAVMQHLDQISAQAKVIGKVIKGDNKVILVHEDE